MLFRSSVLAEGARPLVTKIDLGDASGAALTLMAAASGDEITTTLPAQGHGMFTYFLLKGLNGEARDGTGRVTVGGLFEYLKPRVQDAARRQNREQTPTLQGSGDGVLLGGVTRLCKLQACPCNLHKTCVPLPIPYTV